MISVISTKSFFKKFVLSARRFLGLFGYSGYLKRYFDTDNALSGITAASIIIILEILKVSELLFYMLSAAEYRSVPLIVQNTAPSLLIILSSVILLVYSSACLHKKCGYLSGNIIRVVFAVATLAYGIFISYLDYTKGSQILVFLSMEVIVFGLFLWRPIVSLTLISISFVLFSYVCDLKYPTSLATKQNLFTFALAVAVLSIARFLQKFREARKAEHIENVNIYLGEVAVTDETTGIGNMMAFRNGVGEIRTCSPDDFLSRVFLFLDILNFSSYNKKHGFEDGNRFLNSVAHTIKYTFAGDPVARISDDHFVVFARRDDAGKKIKSIRKKIVCADSGVKLGLKVGAYIPESAECSTNSACDFARYACESIKKKYDVDYCEYTAASAESFERRQYVINNIDRALSEGFVQIYYQPVVLAKNKELCGFEALARWIDSKYGFLPPCDFIPVLEEYRQIHKLDAYILREVCKNILETPKDGLPVLPVSINFSRLDFELMDVEKLLEECIDSRGIDRQSVHIEVTESALSQNDENFKNTLQRLKEKKYSLWLDDFGSGYSGLNILKEYSFDMMKIDMAFLRNFSTTPKTRPILKNIVALANDIGMKTLAEGVETEEAFEFLCSIGCERIQGYLFGKPMPKSEILEKIRKGELLLPKSE